MRFRASSIDYKIRKNKYLIFFLLVIYTLFEVYESFLLLEDKISFLNSDEEWKFYASLGSFSIKIGFFIAIILVLIYVLLVKYINKKRVKNDS